MNATHTVEIDGTAHTLTTKEALRIIWRHTHRDFRGTITGTKTVLTLREGGTTLVDLASLTDAEIADKLKDLPGWYLEDGWIRRVYKTDGWPTTLMLVNAIGYLSEAAYHHPDLSVTWGRITVKLSTHSAGGITDKDFELARKIEDVVLWRPSGGSLEGTPNKFVRSGDPR